MFGRLVVTAALGTGAAAGPLLACSAHGHRHTPLSEADPFSFSFTLSLLTARRDALEVRKTCTTLSLDRA